MRMKSFREQVCGCLPAAADINFGSPADSPLDEPSDRGLALPPAETRKGRNSLPWRAQQASLSGVFEEPVHMVSVSREAETFRAP